MANGCEAYVSTPVRFGKGKSPPFEDFVTAKLPVFVPKSVVWNRSCQKRRKSGGFGEKRQ
jgi:hypothetical protein